MSEQTHYIGRFAPSPTGPLHLGSLCTAVASYLDARANQGKWLLRIENMDPPREQVGADQLIIEALQCHDLNWDGDILWQSTRHDAYQSALQTLLDQQQAFYCSCSRRQLADQQGIHLGDCIAKLDKNDAAVRLRAPATNSIWQDRLQGEIHLDASTIGDVVLKRRDGLYAYQLAVVVDDIFQGVTHVVRGIDLLESTPPQQWLFEHLGAAAPSYLHLPILVTPEGDKLSKQGHAPAIDNHSPEQNLRQVLGYLGQAPAPAGASCREILDWGIAHWDSGKITRSTKITV
ncbi:tRNA glutamyl-Q(34) synthetase GluQRS [Spongiibacter sp. KMU-158]|uniref:Glutamyl-Q tRNA(Asp) synthetase n=1 Tax=Spongiibacter pelagi TaxID=2760804 RepID=A0A927GWQ7_9GAMM|nr:tRNA glutamyl-Q(34) synthetase GluQRS [Spongiibacter pelagi]MBD2860011.1 tRNA glutamyl-Q(34) synthetase GluQRS [Spongiibacter pelagi]